MSSAVGERELPQQEDEAEGPEPVEIDWPDSPFEADLDGDGKPESISCVCEPHPRVQVGKAGYGEAGGYADLMGCAATTVDLDPDTPGRHLLLIGDEHEEAGPDRHILLRYEKGQLDPIWAEWGDIEFYPDGSWQTEEGDCDDVDLVFRTTTSTHRLVDGEVKTQREVSEYEIKAEDCAEP